ncbi:MAG: AraC family transcriptional regulator [Pseudomonadota bacterium]|nr:AraC family transcriptional regulator [Pseudomonadota bacterium]
MIYRAMPALWDPTFRRSFYERWGHESAVISARTRRAEYPEFRQLLSIKAAVGGAEHYFLDGRRITVDDDTFAIFNHNRIYASCVEALQPVHSFSIFFDRSIASQTWHSLAHPAAALDELPDSAGWPVEFAERLYEHENLVSPVLRHIRLTVDAGPVDDAWIEEQLFFLLGRMLRLHYKGARVESVVPSRKPATRRELMRRLNLGVDFMQTRYKDPVLLKDIADAAHLSPFHFLRVFKSVYKVSPSEYLSRKRCAAALRLLQESTWTMNVIAEYVGFGSRTSLYRHLRAHYGVEPRDLRPRR